MAKSIIQKRTNPANRECFLCREEAERIGYYGELPHTGLHRHHFIFGAYGALRRAAEHYGLWGYVCTARHHEYGPEAPHVNNEVATHLKQVAQRAFEERYGHEKWMQEFGKNYLEEDEDNANTGNQSDSGEHEPSGFFRIDSPIDHNL